MTAPAASTPKWRVSDEELGQFKTRALDYKWGARADVMLPAGFIGDLRDARALIAERDAEIARLRAEPDPACQNTEWFWAIVDKDGLTGLPSEEQAALRILVDRARGASIARASGDAADGQIRGESNAR